MNFHVEPGAIDSFSKLVGRAADGSAQAISYTNNYAQIEKSGGGDLWDLVAGDHDSYVHEAKKSLEKVQKVLESSKKELERSADYYRETDRNEAVRIDSLHQGSKAPASSPEGDPQDFSDSSDATNHLKKPDGDSNNPFENYASGHADEYGMNPVQKTLGSALDLGSPSAMAVEASKLLFGFDPFATVTNWVFGDWNKYNECAEAWGNLASFCDTAAANLDKGNRNIGLTWRGNAADAAAVYFDEFSNKLSEIKKTFESLQECYAQAAQLAFQFAEFLKSFLVMFCDWLVIWLINLAAAQAVNVIPVGGQAASVALFALAAAQAIRIMQMWGEAAKAFDTVAAALSALGLTMSAAVNGFSAADGFPEVGTGGYDHQAV
ncbi:type VII secretion target [Streptomyces sp. HB2AG]|uniref:type VII secretion target n=2 Tax=unclassified Streptomyces TaxID=2593676 RepID=UPI0022AB220E|nr:type VII secretion target [Streptomyces sp. HB2AG]MCZ2525996.1 type VII secretion target [Streptomyces sp. HB2AG]